MKDRDRRQTEDKNRLLVQYNSNNIKPGESPQRRCVIALSSPAIGDRLRVANHRIPGVHSGWIPGERSKPPSSFLLTSLLTLLLSSSQIETFLSPNDEMMQGLQVHYWNTTGTSSESKSGIILSLRKFRTY